MNQINTRGIVLTRIDYGEADRIITLLTPDHGKLRLLARGVRKVKSKLAGGIELFSVSSITFIQGRGEIGTLVSSRLETHYGRVVQDIDRTMLGYELIKRLNKATEDEPEPEYFELLKDALAALDDSHVNGELIASWFSAQLLGLSGHTPNLRTDIAGNKLAADEHYDFSYDDMTFSQRPDGHFRGNDIKFLRLLFSGNHPTTLQKIAELDRHLEDTSQLVLTMLRTYIRV